MNSIIIFMQISFYLIVEMLQFVYLVMYEKGFSNEC